MIGGLIFRLFVNGQLVDEAHVQDSVGAEVVADRQKALVEEAERMGHLWCAEVFDPDGPSDCNYHRQGTDQRMMVAPEEMDDVMGQSPLFRRLEREAKDL